MSEFREKLVSPKVYEENLKNYLEKMKEVKEIVIWGACLTGQTVYNFLKKVNLEDKVIGFADNNPQKWGGGFCSLRILSPDEVIEKVKIEDNLCIINAVHLPEVKKQLMAQFIKENQIDMNGYFIAHTYLSKSKDLIMKHIDKCERIYSMLSDSRSKEIYLAKLNYRLSGESKYLVGLMNNNIQYFDKELIKLNENETFVDCGGFNGDTLEIFNQLTKGKYKKYIAFEADHEIYKELEKTVSYNKYSNIILFNRACWYEKAKLKFKPQSISSCITEDGDIIVEADSLDHLINEPVTMIKMDIEGAEENALKGAERLIREYKPILAICIYHKVEDYYTLPLLMKEFNEDYQLYIRHYSRDGADTETVCYAIPKERCL